MDKNIIYLGTELKLNIHIEPIDGITMDNYDFNIDVYVSQRKIVSIPKSECVRIDENNYVVLVDTNVIGVGDLKCRIQAYIPDGDFNDALRTEVQIIDTGINIVKSL